MTYFRLAGRPIGRQVHRVVILAAVIGKRQVRGSISADSAGTPRVGCRSCFGTRPHQQRQTARSGIPYRFCRKRPTGDGSWSGYSGSEGQRSRLGLVPVCVCFGKGGEIAPSLILQIFAFTKGVAHHREHRIGFLVRQVISMARRPSRFAATRAQRTLAPRTAPVRLRVRAGWRRRRQTTAG